MTLTTITDSIGNLVTFGDVGSLEARLGISVDKKISSQKGSGQVFAIANIYKEFEDQTDVTVSGTQFVNVGEGVNVELGLGGRFKWTDAYELFGSVSYATGVDKIGDNTDFTANLGLRFAF